MASTISVSIIVAVSVSASDIVVAASTVAVFFGRCNDSLCSYDDNLGSSMTFCVHVKIKYDDGFVVYDDNLSAYEDSL
ncbi:hypothetical protein V2J09_008065 [Rumex salicifolius]